MDRISGLSEELLVKILSFLPTKVAVSTSILSKQWEFLWMWLPKLEYSSSYDLKTDCEKLQRFLHRNLPLHRAPVLESFRLKFRHSHLEPHDIKLWILAVVSRCVRELKITYTSYPHKPDILPSSLYACKSLVTLKLKEGILVDVPRSMVCLPCLKTLQLQHVTYFNEDSLQRLLSNCPVLEDLLVKGYLGQRKLIVNVPSLRRLTLRSICTELDEFVINTPSLNYLKLKYYNNIPKSHNCLIENMPKLREAYIDTWFPNPERLIRSITSVKRLALCLLPGSLEDDVYGDGFVFNQLEHLKLCICQEYVSSLLVRLLQDSPNLQVLELFGMEEHSRDGVHLWNQPSTVPDCLLSSLQTFKWSQGYLGRPEERNLATYMLQNARCLKTATIVSRPRLSESSSVPSSCLNLRKKLDMIQELALSSRASSACQLVFEW